MMKFDRTAQTLVLAATFTLAAGIVRSGIVMGAHLPETYWAQKLLWDQQFDLVVAGDSRVYRGVSTKAMGLPKLRMANFGFSSCALTRPYLQAVQGLLDPKSPQPTIVLGVTAGALTPASAKDNGFLTLRKLRRFQLAQLALFGRAEFFFSPYDLEEIQHLLQRSQNGYVVVWHPDGWVQSRKIPEDPTEAVRIYRRHAKKMRWRSRVSDQILAELLETVQAWRAKGIRVYAFRPPTPRPMRELEAAYMRFDEPMIVERFEAAGGIWLPFEPDKYVSYDGSHLRDDAAVAFSHDLGRALQRAARASRVARAGGS